MQGFLEPTTKPMPIEFAADKEKPVDRWGFCPTKHSRTGPAWRLTVFHRQSNPRPGSGAAKRSEREASVLNFQEIENRFRRPR